jgi:transposase
MPYDLEIGMDLHKKYSVFGVMNAEGKVLSVDRLSNDTRIFDDYFNRLPSRRVRVTVESTRGVNWVIDYFDAKKVPLVVANPFLNRAIANVHCKNDSYDATTLAHLTRANLSATCFVPSGKIRELRELISHRQRLVQISTKLKNKVHDILSKYNYLEPYAAMFGPKGREWMAKQRFTDLHRNILQETLDLLNEFAPRTLALEKALCARVGDHPYCRLLKSIPGVGGLTAAIIISRVEDITRFPKVHKFVRYAGLSVNTRSSGDKTYLGKLDKKSDRQLRSAFVGAAVDAVKKDPGLAQFYEYLVASKGKGIARVAVARKLARSAYFVMLKQKPYRYRQLQSKWFRTG